MVSARAAMGAGVVVPLVTINVPSVGEVVEQVHIISSRARKGLFCLRLLSAFGAFQKGISFLPCAFLSFLPFRIPKVPRGMRELLLSHIPPLGGNWW